MSSLPAAHKNAALSPLLCAFICAIIPFALQYNYVINAFYFYGAFYFDAGLFANILWHNDWLITTPHIYDHDQSYLAVHLSPLLMLANGISYLVPMHMAEFFAVFMAAIYGSIAAAMGYALMICITPGRYWQVIAIMLLAVGFAFNGVVMQGIWMPHIEYFIPVCIFLFLLHYKQGNSRWATLFFIVALLSREDVGFHLSAVLILLIALRLFKKRSLAEVKKDSIIVLIACSYSICACLLMNRIRAAYGVEESVFQLIYTGNPAYAHLSWQLLSERAVKIFMEAPYLWTGFVISLGWALRRHNPYWLVGFVAYIPWFIANWTAFNPNTGTLYAYYAFPFVLSLGWPFLSILCQYGKQPPSAAVWDATVMQTALVVCGLFVWNIYDHHVDFGPTWWASRWGSYDDLWDVNSDGEVIDTRPFTRKFVNEIATNQGLGTVAADDGVMSLTMGSIAQNRGLNLLSWQTERTVDTLVYFCPFDPIISGDADGKRVQSNLSVHYHAVNAPLCVFTNRTPEQMGVLAKLMTMVPWEPAKSP